jgi:hypothetical protein
MQRQTLNHFMGISQHAVVEKQIKTTGSLRNKMTQHTVLRYPFHSIRFSESCSIVQNFYSFFVGTAHERPRIIAVESMSIDGQQVTTISHCIAEKRQVTIIDISAVEADDIVDFQIQRSSGSLDAQHITYFYNMICRSVDGINEL